MYKLGCCVLTINNIVIIGCGRSGTTFISKHLGLGHEKLGETGIACWQAVVKNNNGFYEITDDDFVLHQVRHPLDAISSCHTIMMDSSWDLIHNNIEQVDIDDSLLSKCMKYWYYWNLMAEKRAISTYRVEEVLSEVPQTTNSRKEWDTYKRIEWSDLKKEDRKTMQNDQEIIERYGYEN